MDLVETVESYAVRLKQAGRNLIGVCPLSLDKHDGFVVSPEKQQWHCFGCGLSGDADAFIRKMEKSHGED